MAFVSVRTILLLLIMMVFVYYLVPRPASFSIAAKTEFLRVDVSDINQPDWYLPRVTACIRSPEATTENATCDQRFDEYTLESVDLRFSQGYTLVFRGFKPGEVEVAVERKESVSSTSDNSVDGEPEGKDKVADVRLDGFDADGSEVSVVLTSGSILKIPFDSLDRPDIATRGFVDLGERPRASAGLLLHSADYEVRQKMGSQTYVVGKGKFLLGDKVNFVRHVDGWIGCSNRVAEPPEIPANFVVSSDRSTSAFNIILTTPNECSALSVTRVGATATELPISWTSRLASDPQPAAFATLLGLLGALVGLSNAYLTPLAKKDEDAQDKSKTS